ncbi:DNA cytosine methyltransferase [Promicromonospora soli]
MTTTNDAQFRYIDLFAGIGGFAAALEAFGGEGVYSVEIDPWAAKVYELNWGHSPLGDITKDADNGIMNVPAHDLLAAGFPCQPFSKSGAQRGMDETRGTLFFNILTIIKAHHPTVVLLENVRNLAGPRHKHEWDVIIRCLREEGYHVSETPTVFSPHLLPLERGGRPQVRERVFITATYDPDGLMDVAAVPPIHNISVRGNEEWSLDSDLPLDSEFKSEETQLSADELRWIAAWDAFVQMMWPLVRRREGEGAKLPGFPLWVDHWVHTDDLVIPDGTPSWKENFLRKNSSFYTAHQAALDGWMKAFSVQSFPPSRRKFEWQAQQAKTLWECAMQMRPSGIRAKRLTHLPALVAITQTSIIGPLKRRLSWREAARLQGLTDNFDFGDQAPPRTFKQLGNGVSIGAVWNVLRAHAERDETILKSTPTGRSIYNALVRDAPKDPTDEVRIAIDRGQERYASQK